MKIPLSLKPNNAKSLIIALLFLVAILISLFVGRFIFLNLKMATSPNPALVSELTPRIDIASIKKATQILEQKTAQIAVSKPSPQPQSAVSPVPTVTPAPSPQSEEKKAIQIDILNGSSKTNAILPIAQKLESLGFSIKNTASADRQNYTATIIRLKDKANQYYEEIKQTLYPTFANFVQERLTDQSTVDIVIILGQ